MSMRRQFRRGWREQVPDTQRLAYARLRELDREGRSRQERLRSKVYWHIVECCTPGARFMAIPFGEETPRWLPYRGAVSATDVTRFYGDYTSHANRVTELKQQGMIESVGRRRDLVNGNLKHFFVPTKRITPLPRQPSWKHTLLDILEHGRNAYENDEMSYREFWQYMHRLLYSEDALILLPEDDNDNEGDGAGVPR